MVDFEYCFQTCKSRSATDIFIRSAISTNLSAKKLYTLKTCGIAETMMGSSSMDFASEEGFETDDGAMLLLKRALELV